MFGSAPQPAFMEDLSPRAMLARTGLAGATLVTAVSAAVPDTEAQTSGPGSGKPKLKIVVTGGHPGDPEYGCGGTVARYTDLGHEVLLLYLTQGEPPGSTQRKGERVEEA